MKHLVFIFSLLIELNLGAQQSIPTAILSNFSRPFGGDFSLQGFNGPIDTKLLRGKNIFLYFGFLTCGHSCPMTLANLKSMLKNLPILEQKNVNIIFISVDNERDTLDKLEKYFSPHGSQFLAGVTDEGNLRAIMAKFGARYAKLKTKSNVLLVDHTNSIFTLNKLGIWTDTLSFDATAEQLLDAYKQSDKIDLAAIRQAKNLVVQPIGENKNCDLSKQVCMIESGEKKSISVALNPSPIKLQKSFTVTVETKNPELTPVEIDFQGELINMGFIRPKLKPGANGMFETNLTLPICELKKMKWNINLILKDHQNHFYTALFHLETKD